MRVLLVTSLYSFFTSCCTKVQCESVVSYKLRQFVKLLVVPEFSVKVLLVTSSDSLSFYSTSCCLRVQCESFVSYKFRQFV